MAIYTSVIKLQATVIPFATGVHQADLYGPHRRRLAYIACTHCRRKVRQFHFCATVSLLCDSLTFVRQCGHAGL